MTSRSLRTPRLWSVTPCRSYHVKVYSPLPSSWTRHPWQWASGLGKGLAARNALPPRHLEPILQELVRAGILKSTPGRHGGYELGREYQQITIEDILRATQILEHAEVPAPGSPRLDRVVLPALAQAERLFSSALSRISIADLQVQVSAPDCAIGAQ
jgi:Rrf2 family protein